MNTDNSTNQQQRPDPAVSAALNFIRPDGKLAYSKTRSPVYVAGPMTGLPDLNYPAFDTAAKHLRGYGFAVENPAENEQPNPTPTWEDWMRLGLTQMLRCNSVLLLPGWHTSKGAVIEARIALDLGLLVIDGETGAALPADHAVTLQQQPATTQAEADTAAAPKAEPVQQKDILAPEFTGIAEYKLNDLLARGFSINGYSIEQTHEGAPSLAGLSPAGALLVGWWTSDAEIDARAARLAAARTQQEGER